MKALRNEKQCLAKKVFWTQEHANVRALELTRTTDMDWRWYRCPNCMRFHLSTKRKKTPKQKPKRPVRFDFRTASVERMASLMTRVLSRRAVRALTINGPKYHRLEFRKEQTERGRRLLLHWWTAAMRGEE